MPRPVRRDTGSLRRRRRSWTSRPSRQQVGAHGARRAACHPAESRSPRLQHLVNQHSWPTPYAERSVTTGPSSYQNNNENRLEQDTNCYGPSGPGYHSVWIPNGWDGTGMRVFACSYLLIGHGRRCDCPSCACNGRVYGSQRRRVRGCLTFGADRPAGQQPVDNPAEEQPDEHAEVRVADPAGEQRRQ